MKKYVKFISLAVCMLSAVVIMSGCSLLGPRNASDVMKNYEKAMEKVENYHIEGTMDITESMKAENAEVQEYLKEYIGSENIEIPINMDMSINAGRETAHGDVDVDMSFAGQSTSMNIEMYIDDKEGYTYSKEKGAAEWTKEKTNSSFLSLSDASIDPKELDAFEFAKIDNGYTLTASMKDLKDLDLLDSMSGYLGNTTVSDFEIDDSGKVIYTFDKKCRLVAVDMKDIMMSGKEDLGSGLGNLVCDISMDVKIRISKYNELNEDDYSIPAKVIKNAVEGTSGTGTLPIGGDTPAEPEPEPTTPAEPEPEPSTPAPSSGGVTLDGSKVQGQGGKYCFTVGQDLAAGTYKVYKVSGSGIVSVTDAVTYDQNYNLSIGYGLPDDTQDGETIVLENGDEIYVTSSLIIQLK